MAAQILLMGCVTPCTPKPAAIKDFGVLAPKRARMFGYRLTLADNPPAAPTPSVAVAPPAVRDALLALSRLGVAFGRRVWASRLGVAPGRSRFGVRVWA